MNAPRYQIDALPSPFPFYAKVFGKRKGFRDGDAIPRIEVRWEGFRFDEATVRAYADACGLTMENGRIPVLFPHSYFGPLHLKMITDTSFPLAMLGSLHLRNHLIQHRPLDLGGSYQATLAFTGERRRPQGLEIDFRTEIRDSGDLVWESVSTFLVRKKFQQEDAETPLAAALQPVEQKQERGRFPVPANTGRRFGWITKDLNPIHVSKMLAKAFGFKRDLCHGMWALARSLPSFDRIDATRPIRVDVAFKGPLYMEEDIAIIGDATHPDRFELYSGKNERPCVVARIENVAPGADL